MGHNFPITLNASGALLTGEQRIQAHIALGKDLYRYKYLARPTGNKGVGDKTQSFSFVTDPFNLKV